MTQHLYPVPDVEAAGELSSGEAEQRIEQLYADARRDPTHPLNERFNRTDPLRTRYMAYMKALHEAKHR